MKLKHPALITKETNPTVLSNLKKLYTLFGGSFDGYLLRI